MFITNEVIQEFDTVKIIRVVDSKKNLGLAVVSKLVNVILEYYFPDNKEMEDKFINSYSNK